MKDDCSKVLIIDDSRYICCQVERILETEPLYIYKAHTGSDAISMIERVHPDVILLDIILPDIDGYSLYKKIKKVDDNNAAILFLTSKDQESDVVKGLELGACDYIKKPFHNDILKFRILSRVKEKKREKDLLKMNEEMRNNLERLNSMVFRDSLTGLYNRRFIMEQLEKHQSDSSIILIMADVDDFKRVNDNYGHEVGDMVLIGISNIMKTICENHYVSRWGGEEFLIMLLDVTRQEALETGEGMRKEIESFLFSFKDFRFSCTVSFGLAAYSRDKSTKENIKCADKALYYGKRNGKNCCAWYDEKCE